MPKFAFLHLIAEIIRMQFCQQLQQLSVDKRHYALIS
jgi:hypothetical protein